MNCGKEFIPIKPYSKFCSYQCFNEHRLKGKKRTFKCLNCGEEFVPTKASSKYCSYECFNEHRNARLAASKQAKTEEKKQEQEEWEKLNPADKMLFGKQKEKNPDLTRKEFLERLRQK